jgi:cytochrome c551/c552
MKNLIKIGVPVIAFILAFTLNSNTTSKTPVNTEVTSITKLEIPGNVQSILDKSCVMCHNSESKNTKGKMKLNFDHFTDGKYSTGKLIGKLRGITKVLGKTSMPPKKFLAKYPDKALTADESKTLLDWATEQGKALAGQ